MNRILALIVSIVSFCIPLGCLAEIDDPLFHSHDPLAARDEYGRLHQSPSLNETDFAPRYATRSSYYCLSGRTLARDPAYVGALQTALRRLSYYCGPIDGVFSDEVIDALEHMQKNYSMRVTGTISIPVRRALCLP